jgi:Tfp pilus assembly protein PilE
MYNIEKSKGFTLVELLVVMAIFITVIILVSNSFNLILTQSSKLVKSEESNIEGVVGLEFFRHDLTEAGYGLPSEVLPVAYSGEANSGQSANLNDVFTDGTYTAPPRPLAALERSANGCASTTTETPDSQGYLLRPCSDYLALKGTSLGISAASKKWTYLTVSSSVVLANTWADSKKVFAASDSVVVLSRTVSTSSNAMSLQANGKSFYYSYSGTAFSNMSGMGSSVLDVYGIGTGTPRMPFNRTDYFVATPPTTAAQQVGAHCASGTGILYKALVSHTNKGLLDYYPLLDCVAGMQVELGWDTDGDGLIDTWSNADGSSTSGTASQSTIQTALQSPAIANSPNLSIVGTGLSIRSGLKMIKVYILAQIGKKDTNYTSPSPIIIGDTDKTTINYSLDVATAGWSNYRWKLYRIVVIPKNLLVNQ